MVLLYVVSNQIMTNFKSDVVPLHVFSSSK